MYLKIGKIYNLKCRMELWFDYDPIEGSLYPKNYCREDDPYLVLEITEFGKKNYKIKAIVGNRILWAIISKDFAETGYYCAY